MSGRLRALALIPLWCTAAAGAAAWVAVLNPRALPVLIRTTRSTR